MILVLFIYLESIRVSHRFCLYPTSPSSLSGLAVPSVMITVLSNSCMVFEGKKLLRKHSIVDDCGHALNTSKVLQRELDDGTKMINDYMIIKKLGK